MKKIPNFAPPKNTPDIILLSNTFKNDMHNNNKHKLQNIRHLTDSTYVLEMERRGMEFESGQHILLDYTVLHGVKYAGEAYDKDSYDPERYILCTSRDNKGDFHGRVTDYIKQHDFDKNTACYFCGNFNMIRDAMKLLDEKGIPAKHLHAEVYF